MEKIKYLKKDPRTVENAAKADVWILNNKKITSDVLNTKTIIRQKKKRGTR